MNIIADTREHREQWDRIRKGFERLGVHYERRKLDVGDYQDEDNPLLVVDRKHNLAEVAQNFTDQRRTREGLLRNRLEDEMIRAQKQGIKIVFLVEHGGSIKSIEDVQLWKNPRTITSPLAISGPRIYRKMLAYEKFYGVEFRFCGKQQTAKRIVEILQEGAEHGEG